MKKIKRRVTRKETKPECESESGIIIQLLEEVSVLAKEGIKLGGMAVCYLSALEESIKRQNQYATLLNSYDNGTRRKFKNANEWIGFLDGKMAKE